MSEFDWDEHREIFWLETASVEFSVTTRTKCNQVLQKIATELTSGFQMMDL
jgi:hypothetical protein